MIGAMHAARGASVPGLLPPAAARLLSIPLESGPVLIARAPTPAFFKTIRRSNDFCANFFRIFALFKLYENVYGSFRNNLSGFRYNLHSFVYSIGYRL